MWSYILTAFISSAASVGLLLLHQYIVRRAVRSEQVKARRDANQLRSENARLREDIAAYELSSEAARAREQGKIVGMREARNESNYRRFEQAVNGDGRRTVHVGSGGTQR